MEVKSAELSYVICDVFKMQQSNGLLLCDKEKWREAQELKGIIWSCCKISIIVPISHLMQYI